MKAGTVPGKKESAAKKTGLSRVSGSSSVKESGVNRKSGGKPKPVPQHEQPVGALLQSDDPLKQAIINRVMRMLANTLRNASLHNLQQAVEAPTDAGSAAYVVSMAASMEDAVRQLDPTAAAIIRGAGMKKDLLHRAGGVLETARVAELLGISRQGVLKRVQSGSLLAIKDASGHLQFPALQFTSTGTVDNLEKVLAAFTVESPWTRLAVLLDTDEAVGGKRIIDALRDGELQGVLDVVGSFGA